MLGHPVEVTLYCACTRVIVARPGYFISRLGEHSTPRDAERRMRCRTCRERPTLKLSRCWSVSTPVALPDWMGL
jgi:hypothetical protein